MTTDGTRSYRTGDWYAVLGDAVAVLLPPSERARVPAVWELVDRGADADEVLDALIAGGLRSLPAFVLLADSGDRLRVLLRGPARAGIDTLDGPVALDGTDATTWVERVLPGVTAVRVDVAEHAEGADRPVDAGLVRVGRLDRPPYVEPTPEPESTPERFPAVEAEPAPEPAPEPEPVADLVEAPDEEEPADLPTEAIDLGGLSFLDDPDPADHDGTTRTPRAGDPAPPAPEAGDPVARLTFSDGDVVEVDRSVLVGRAPEARRFSVTDQPRLVTVTSPHQEISSTHLEIRPGEAADLGSAVVTDLGSTNGTVLVQPGLPPEVLQPGIAVQLLPGAVVDLGDGVTIRVEYP